MARSLIIAAIDKPDADVDPPVVKGPYSKVLAIGLTDVHREAVAEVAEAETARTGIHFDLSAAARVLLHRGLALEDHQRQSGEPKPAKLRRAG